MTVRGFGVLVRTWHRGGRLGRLAYLVVSMLVLVLLPVIALTVSRLVVVDLGPVTVMINPRG